METTYAYLAGIIDVDGYILIRRVVIGPERRYIPVIGISENSPTIPDLFQSVFPATRQQFQPKLPKQRPVYWWEAHFTHVATPLRCLMPYLRIKQPQAKLTLSLLDLYSRKGAPTDDEWAARQHVYEEVAKLNGPRSRHQIKPVRST